MSGKKLRILLTAERKSPPDKRVAFTPEQCRIIENQYPQIKFYMEESAARCILDAEYHAAGIESARPQEADILFGIKEVPIEFLIPGKTWFFFSHTIKKQPHNRKLLKSLLENKIELIDYECLVDNKGERTVAFGRFAGIVGAYNAFRLWLEKKSLVRLPPASACHNTEELIAQVRPWLPSMKGLKIAVTGTGRVGMGAVEILEKLGIRRLDPQEYCNSEEEQPVYTLLRSQNYMEKPDSSEWDETGFRSKPGNYRSTFLKFASCTDVFISCHYWNPAGPPLFHLADIASADFRISVISDVTCDIGGSIPTTLRASTIAHPFYEVDRISGCEVQRQQGSKSGTVGVCAVDNLPCELPLDASRAFGEMLMKQVIPELAGSDRQALERATICRDGHLMPDFAYLQDFADGKEA